VKNLLVPIDFSKVTNQVVATAEEFSRAFGAKVWLLHCVRDYPLYAPLEDVSPVMPNEKDWASQFPDQYHRFSAIASWLKERGIEVEPLFAVGVPADEVLYVADKFQIDLIIMGSHGHGAFYDMVVGSVANSVLHRARCRTLIVPSDTEKQAAPVKSPAS
jgi:nucleotide-binding universal stress UspA family protein